MRRCAICHDPLIPGMCVERTSKPKVTVCFKCIGIRVTEDGRVYYDPEKDRTKGRWDRWKGSARPTDADAPNHS